MFIIDEDTQTIHITRGDIMIFDIEIKNDDDSDYAFQEGDVVRFSVYDKGNYNSVRLRESVTAVGGEDYLEMILDNGETKIGDIIEKPKDYWYELELNPDTNPQTILGHDKQGAKIFRLYPEGVDEYES